MRAPDPLDRKPVRAGTRLPLLACLVLLALVGGQCVENTPTGEDPAPGTGTLATNTPVPGLTLILAGDVMLGRGIAQALDGEWAAAFAEVRPWLDGPDSLLVVANLESPLTALPQVEAGYDLRAPPEAAAALAAAGFDALSLANNHALDAGQAGMDDTIDALRGAGIVPWMPGTMADMPGVPSVRGLAFDDSAAPLDGAAAAALVADAAAQAEVVVVSIHWGGEYQAAPSARQQTLAQAFAKAGATVIAGHGPHVLQRVEWVGETLVAYSLGNLLFDQPYPADCRQGAFLRVTIEGAQIVAVDAVPTVIERGRVRRAEGEDARAIADRLRLEKLSYPP